MNVYVGDLLDSLSSLVNDFCGYVVRACFLVITVPVSIYRSLPKVQGIFISAWVYMSAGCNTYVPTYVITVTI